MTYLSAWSTSTEVDHAPQLNTFRIWNAYLANVANGDRAIYENAFIEIQVFPNIGKAAWDQWLHVNRKYKDYVYRKMFVQEYLKK